MLSEVAKGTRSARLRLAHEVLVEPFIEGTFQKFNSNTGKVNPDYEVMQALSHFSYDYTGGQEVLCDLQGGNEASGSAVLSKDGRIALLVPDPDGSPKVLMFPKDWVWVNFYISIHEARAMFGKQNMLSNGSEFAEHML